MWFRATVIALVAGSPLMSLPAQPNPQLQVAVAPFTVVNDSAGTLRRVADDCLSRLTSALAAKGVTVMRHENLGEKTLSQARPAAYAILGEFRHDKSGARGELRLMDVATGEELRSYFNSTRDLRDLHNLAEMGRAAGERIAQVMKEKRD